MSEVRFVIREAECDWCGTIHGSSADRAIAALSADPVTLNELEVALERFQKPTVGQPFFAHLSRGLCDEPYDAGLVVIDLAARLVVVDSSYSCPGPRGRISYHDGHGRTIVQLNYHLAGDWLFTHDSHTWQCQASSRRQARAGRPVLDARQVFYGRPLVEFLARESFAAYPQHDAISKIHAAWLLTPREDLGGECPRTVALAQHDHIAWDMQDRCEQWSCVGQCPRGLEETSFAFRYGGFGTHELVQYYDLVRELLWSCNERIADHAPLPPASAATETAAFDEFLAAEVPRLESIRDRWLTTPDPDCYQRTPRSIIDRERARLPETVSGHDAVVDPDCPLCQMMSEMPGPCFWHLDGSHMDDEFAFDIYCLTREEWEEQMSNA